MNSWYALVCDTCCMLEVLSFVQEQAQFGHPVQHPSQPPWPAPDLPKPAKPLCELYIVCAVDVFVSSVDLRHLTFGFPE
jgi:hypothetical protein